MKFISSLLLSISLSLGSNSYGQESNLRAYLDSKQFFAPGSGNYIELYFQFVGYSIRYKGIESGLQAELAVALTISEGDSIVRSDAYRLQSPVMKDSIIEDFYDVKRFGLEPGRYKLNLEIQDLNGNGKIVKASQPLIIEDLGKAISLSDIEVIEYAKKDLENSPFFKSGYHMVPRLSTFYPEELSSIPVYLELYNTHTMEDSICAIKQSIVNMVTGEELSELTIFSKLNTQEVIPVLRNVDITMVPSGKYSLNYTLLSKKMTEMSTQTYLFERVNDQEIAWNAETIIIDPAFQASIPDDSVRYFLESLIPISKPAEVKNIIATLKLKNKDSERKHIQSFWSQSSPNNPYEGWITYKEQVQLVEKLYSNNFQEGFETDRGRVYLQYGAPTNIIARETSPTEYPYEIWQYNKIGKFSNKRFIFYNPDLVNNTYRLLHSDMIGELKNPSWSLTLSKRNTNNGNVDDPNSKVQEHWGGDSNDLFRQY